MISNRADLPGSPMSMGAIHSTKIPTGATGKSGPPQKVDQYFRNFSGWNEPIHRVLAVIGSWFWTLISGNFGWMDRAPFFSARATRAIRQLFYNLHNDFWGPSANDCNLFNNVGNVCFMSKIPKVSFRDSFLTIHDKNGKQAEHASEKQASLFV